MYVNGDGCSRIEYRFKEVISKALKPFIVICITSICLSGITFTIIKVFY